MSSCRDDTVFSVRLLRSGKDRLDGVPGETLNLTIMGDVDTIIPVDEVAIERPKEWHQRHHHDLDDEEGRLPGLSSVQR